MEADRPALTGAPPSRRLPAPAAGGTLGPDGRRSHDIVRERALPATSGGDYFGCLLHSPTFAEHLARFGMLVRSAPDAGPSYSHVDRELADVVVSLHVGYLGALEHHLGAALAVGVRADAIDALLRDRPDLLEPDERLVVDFIIATLDGTVTDELFAAFTDRVGTRGTVEYAVFVTGLAATLRLHQAFGIDDLDRDQVLTFLNLTSIPKLA